MYLLSAVVFPGYFGVERQASMLLKDTKECDVYPCLGSERSVFSGVSLFSWRPLEAGADHSPSSFSRFKADALLDAF